MARSAHPTLRGYAAPGVAVHRRRPEVLDVRGVRRVVVAEVQRVPELLLAESAWRRSSLPEA